MFIKRSLFVAFSQNLFFAFEYFKNDFFFLNNYDIKTVFFCYFFVGLNLSLKGQRIIPKVTQKREIKCERTENNKSLQSIYTLARLASSSNRVRRNTGSSSGPTIMDFNKCAVYMQCINFKSRLDREREMIRRKIRSSTLYRKPSFGKSSGFNIYNGFNNNGDISKVSVISKNIKINEYRDEPLKKTKSSLLLTVEDAEDENSNEEKGILCVAGSKYLDLTSNLITTSLGKSVSSSTLNLINNELLLHAPDESDFEKAISQSHLSPSSPSMLHPSNSQALFLRQQDTKEKSLSQENLMKLKTAKNFINNKSDDSSKLSSDCFIDGEEEIQDFQTPSLSDNIKRKDHKKLFKKSTHFLYVGKYVGKYSDAKKTEVGLDDLPNSIITQNNQYKTQNTPVSSTCSAKKSGISSRKKSSHSKKSDTKAGSSKSNSPKTTSTRKSESS
jgi:hypothetical protein